MPQGFLQGAGCRALSIRLKASRDEGAFVAVLGKVGIGAAGQDVRPCGLELGARLLEGSRDTVSADAAMRERKEPAEPSPLVGILRHPGPLGDRADLHIAVEDLPAFLVAVFLAVSGEGVHGCRIARATRRGKPVDLVAGLRNHH